MQNPLWEKARDRLLIMRMLVQARHMPGVTTGRSTISMCDLAARRRHVLEVHRAAGQRAEGSAADAAEEAFFKRYLEYARSKVSPRLSEAAAASLVSQYVELREQARLFWHPFDSTRPLDWLLGTRPAMHIRKPARCPAQAGPAPAAVPGALSGSHCCGARHCSRKQARMHAGPFLKMMLMCSAGMCCARAQGRAAARESGGGAQVVPITVRQLEAVVRIAESFARMQLQPVATEAHVRRALSLFTVSTMDAVKSGAVESVVRAPSLPAAAAWSTSLAWLAGAVGWRKAFYPSFAADRGRLASSGKLHEGLEVLPGALREGAVAACSREVLHEGLGNLLAVRSC
jgi:hypothetical protein